MDRKISVPELKRNLSQCKSASDRLAGLNKGTKYLYENFLARLLRDEPVKFGDLDYTQFGLSDIEDLSECYGAVASDTHNLRSMCSVLAKTPCSPRPVTFI